MAKFNCAYCQGESGVEVNTYKHEWVVCQLCGNAFRSQKSKYLLPMLFPGPLGLLIPKKIKALFYPAEAVKLNKSIAYDYYAGISGNKTAIGTKWEGELDTLLADLRGLNIELEGKTVLDISGGPGFRVKEMQGLTKRAVVTEYSQVAVDGMARNLGIEAIKYDYNSDQIDQAVGGKFEVILVINSMNYCFDLETFANDLKKVMNKDSVVFVNCVLPTLGYMLRWQLLEYNYNILYSYKSLRKTFLNAGFEIVAEQNRKSGFYGFNYLSRYSKKSIRAMMLNFLRLASSIPYLIPAMFKSGLNKEKSVNKQILVLKLKEF